MQHESLVVLLLVGLPVLVVAVPLLAWFSRLMGEIHFLISVPLFIVFPPVFFAFLAGLPCILVMSVISDSNAMSDLIAEARANNRYSEPQSFSRSEPRAEREAPDEWHPHPNWQEYTRRERRIEARGR